MRDRSIPRLDFSSITNGLSRFKWLWASANDRYAVHPLKYTPGFVVCCFLLLISWWHVWCPAMETLFPMMTSSNGNISRVTGLLCREFRCIPHTKASDAQLWCFFYLRLNLSGANVGDAGNLRHHRAHYDVIEMRWNPIRFWSLSYLSSW